MTVAPQDTQVTEPKTTDKELNFRKQEEMFKRQLDQERQGRLQAEARAAELEKAKSPPQDDEEDDDAEPYVDKRKLNKKLNKFAETSKQQTQQDIQTAVQQALQEERKANWLKSNPDFRDVMQHAEKFAEKDPDLAESILSMPDSFERQKLVYKNIKALGIHKPEEKKPTIQDTIDKNRRTPYYQPTSVGTAPYAGYVTGGKDYTATEQQTAYNQMKELQKRLRIG